MVLLTSQIPNYINKYFSLKEHIFQCWTWKEETLIFDIVPQAKGPIVVFIFPTYFLIIATIKHILCVCVSLYVCICMQEAQAYMYVCREVRGQAESLFLKRPSSFRLKQGLPLAWEFTK